MRRTAAGLSAQLRGEVRRAAAIGAGALTVTAFLAVGREGLETTLFLWTAARASGSTAAPLAGAGLGLAAAVALCWLLYRRAIRLNIGVFFSRTAIALIVIAAGVLAVRPGRPAERRPAARAQLDRVRPDRARRPELVVGLDHHRGHRAVPEDDGAAGGGLGQLPGRGHAALPPGGPAPRPPQSRHRSPLNAECPRLGAAVAARRPWAVAGVLVVVPALAAGADHRGAAVRRSRPPAPRSPSPARGCARDWTAGQAGTQTFTVRQPVRQGRRDQPGQRRRRGGRRDRDASGPATTGPDDRHARPGFLQLQVLPVRAGRTTSAGRSRSPAGGAGRPGRGQAGHRARPDRPEQGLPGVRRHATLRTPGQRRSRRSRPTCAAGNLAAARTRLAGRAAGLGAGRRVLRQLRRRRHRGRRAARRAARRGERPGLHRAAPAGVRAVAWPARRGAAAGGGHAAPPT